LGHGPQLQAKVIASEERKKERKKERNKYNSIALAP